MMEQILSMIGLAMKAGKVAIGEEPVGSAARAKHARVILVARDAAPGSARRAYSFAQSGSCLCLTIPADKDALGRALGRTSCAMAAITDIGLAEAVVKKLAAADPQRFDGAAQQMAIKARRAAQRRQEKLQHEKNVHQGKKKKSGAPAAEEAAEKAEEKRPALRRSEKRGQRPAKHHDPRPQVPRFAFSLPVKKGKGSVKKKKKS